MSQHSATSQTQKSAFDQDQNCCLFVHNYFLNLNINEYKNHGRRLSLSEMIDELFALKILYPWLKTADSQLLYQTLADLDRVNRTLLRKKVKLPHKISD